MYAILDDLLEQIADGDLISLTDDDQLGFIDETVVTRAIVNAMTVINSYCEERYTTPFVAPVPDLVRLFSCDLAIYNLYSRRGHVEIPEAVKDRQKQALAYLKRVQEGAASIGGAAAAPVDSGSSAGIIPGNERIFSRDRMRGL